MIESISTTIPDLASMTIDDLLGIVDVTEVAGKESFAFPFGVEVRLGRKRAMVARFASLRDAQRFRLDFITRALTP